jgi:hypothetical protein
MTSQIRTAIMVKAHKLVASRVVLAATVLIVATAFAAPTGHSWTRLQLDR